MATVTRTIAILADDVSGELATLEVDYDDVQLRINVVRCINPTSLGVVVVAERLSNGRTYTNTFPAGQTSAINIPSGPNDRLAVTIDARGRLDGVEYHVSWAA
jgi:hypothetical protein